MTTSQDIIDEGIAADGLSTAKRQAQIDAMDDGSGANTAYGRRRIRKKKKQAQAALDNPDPDKQMAQIYKRQLESFQDNQVPMINDMEASLSDRTITERGEVEAGRMGANAHGMTTRINSGRDNQLLASQSNTQRTRVNKASALARGSTLTSSRDLQRDNDVATRRQLMGISEQLSATGTASMAQAAQAQSDRKARNEAAGKSKNAQIGGMIGMAAGAIVGGPVGASVGAAAGGYIGGQV